MDQHHQHIKSNDLDISPRRPSSSFRDERRSSLATSAITKQEEDITSKDTKRPLNAVMSEDFLSSAPFLANKSTLPPPPPPPPITSTQKQSFLSKFARSEVKTTTKSIDKSSRQNVARTSEQSKMETTSNNSTKQLSISNNNINDIINTNNETESDKGAKMGESNLKQSGLASGNLLPDTRAIKSLCDADVNDSIRSLLQRVGDIKSNVTPSKGYTATTEPATSTSTNKDDDDDDNNQVLPIWPSRIEAAAALEPALIQHQVYSLKNYSQIAGPIESVGQPLNTTPNARLQKSMSQDRKVGSRPKRMSECIVSGASIDTSKASRQQRLPSMIGKISAGSNLSNPGMGPASSVNSLLLPTSKNSSSLIGESRIDRMRKLFVSPLSLRASTSGSAASKPSSSSAQTHTNQSRLSLQAGANMLNKPHHLMHMYRARVAVGAHHSRRSPMRQKQGNLKGFRVYGCPLSMANTMYPITCFGRPDIYKQQAVPYILARLCNYIEENSSHLTHEGIFRVSGNARLMEKLKTLFDHLGDAPLESESVDVATSASMLKMYLRELPDPLIPTRMNYYFFTLAKKYSSLLFKSGGGLNGFRVQDNQPSGTITNTTIASVMPNEASSISDSQSTLDRHKLAFLRDLTKLIRKLPIENYNLLKYLACFLHRISLKQLSNKMSAEALGIVFGPNVFRIRSESYKGLKEQELSNQIMASIISNYKQIFDCELTDPLGNLIKTDELLFALATSQQEIAQNSSENLNPSQSIDLPAVPSSSSRVSKGEHTLSPGGSVACTSKQAQTPSATSSNSHHHNHSQNQQHPKVRCPRHGHPVAHYRYRHEADESDDDDATVDEDDDDDGHECDEDSYSRTSDSGSYCSSLASDTMESTYEGDIEGGPYDDDDEDDDDDNGDDDDDEDGDHLARTSSDCGSETSYTPSSSHSDSDDDDPGAELSSSNFSSNASLTGDANDGTNPSTGPSGPHKSCSVCRRRESAQLEAAAAAASNNNRMRQVEPTPATSTSVAKSILESESELPIEITKQVQIGDLSTTFGQGSPVATQQSPGQGQLAGSITTRQDHGRGMSTRRKRTAAAAANEHTSKITTDLPSHKAAVALAPRESNMSSSDTALNTSASKQDFSIVQFRELNESHKSLSSSSSSPSQCQDIQHANKQLAGSHKRAGLLRRRSSSASSLLRIANRHEHSMHYKRNALKDGDHIRQHHRNTTNTNIITSSSSSSRGTSNRHRMLDPTRGFTRKSRFNRAHQSERKRTTSHNNQRTQQAVDQRISSTSNASTGGQRFDWNKGDYHVPELMTLNLSPQNRRELVWNYVSSGLLDLPESERFFQLRSYNSDETLLRSQPEPSASTTEDERSGLLARRRFSGQDHLQANQQNLLANACTEFNQIFETYEGERGLGKSGGGGDPLVAVIEAKSLASELLRPCGLATSGASANVIDSSMISLLGDQMLSFKHSTLSLNGNTANEDSHRLATDPIVAQLKVTRDLVKALQRLTKYGTTNGFNQDISAYLLDLLTSSNLTNLDGEQPGEINDQPGTQLCYIDHLTGRKIVDSLDNFKRDVDDLPKVDPDLQDRIIELLGAKIAELKKRYNNLKYIREHYHRHHLTRANKSDAATLPQPVRNNNKTSPEKSSPASIHDGNLHRSDQDALSIDSTLNNLSQTSKLEGGALSQGTAERSGSCKFGSLCPVEFVFNIEKHLASRRHSGSRQVRLQEMTLAQLSGEKLELQKNLLRYEHWFGRPTTRAEFNLVGHLYERYRAVKIIKQQKQSTD